MTKGLIRRIDLGTTTSDSDKIPANVDKPSPEKIFIPSKPVKQIKERKPREPKPKFDNSEDHTEDHKLLLEILKKLDNHIEPGIISQNRIEEFINWLKTQNFDNPMVRQLKKYKKWSVFSQVLNLYNMFTETKGQYEKSSDSNNKSESDKNDSS